MSGAKQNGQEAAKQKHALKIKNSESLANKFTKNKPNHLKILWQICDTYQQMLF